MKEEIRNYTYTGGSHGTASIDTAGKLPKDRGKTKYAWTAADESGILSDISIDAYGNLKYTVDGNKNIGDTAAITVTARMEHYHDTSYTVKITLVDNIEVQFAFETELQESVYNGRPHNGYTALAAETVNGSYTGGIQL